jgi:DNA-binding MarR family transcriptional regulator
MLHVMTTIDQKQTDTATDARTGSADTAGAASTEAVEGIIGDFMAAVRELRCRGTQRLVKQDVSMTHLHIMWLLEHHSDLTMGHLADMLDVSLSNATGLIDRMEERGFVERVRVPDDRRIVQVRLSAKGRAVLEDVEVLKSTMLRRVLGRLDRSQLERLATTLEDVRQAIHAETAADPDTATAFGLQHHTH